MRATRNVKLCAGDHVVTKIKNTWHHGIFIGPSIPGEVIHVHRRSLRITPSSPDFGVEHNAMYVIEYENDAHEEERETRRTITKQLALMCLRNGSTFKTSEDFATFCSTGTFLSIDMAAIIPKNPPRKRITMDGIFDSCESLRKAL